MANKRRPSPAHPYEPEPSPILEAWPEFWWMSEPERAPVEEALAWRYGGDGVRPRPSLERER